MFLSGRSFAFAFVFVLGNSLCGCAGAPPQADDASAGRECEVRGLAKLYLGRSRGTARPEISLSEVEAFVASEVTTRFGGATVFEARGAWTPEGTNDALWERSVVVEIVFDGSVKSEDAIELVARNYAEKFGQESVLLFLGGGCARFVSVKAGAK